MLSLTYTQAALIVEQESVRAHVSSFRHFFRKECKDKNAWSHDMAEQLLHKIKRVHLNCSWRRLEAYVLPEIRNATRSADLLLAELESLRLLGLEFYRLVRDQLREAVKGKAADTRYIFWSMELYCQTLMALLAKEEQELFGVAFESIPEDTWFSIAERFMQQDKKMLECGGMGEVAYPQQHEPNSLASLWSSSGTPRNPSAQTGPAVLPGLDTEKRSHHVSAIESAPRPVQGAIRAV